MNKVIAVAIIAMCCCGCGGCGCADRLIEKIPNAEFESFSYHRGGNVTSANVTASKSKIKDNKITIESLEIQEDWGPAFNFNLEIKGYSREINGAEEQKR